MKPFASEEGISNWDCGADVSLASRISNLCPSTDVIWSNGG